MMREYKRYDEYKDSGVEWIGQVPKSWDKFKFKMIVDFVSGSGFPLEFQGYLNKEIYFAKVSDINGNNKFIYNTNNTVSKKESINQNWEVIPKDSILTAKIGEAMKMNHRKMNKEKMIIDNNMIALVLTSNIDNYYLYYYTKNIDFDWYSNMGAIPSLNVRELKDSYIYIPNTKEQQKIASFLDQKTAKIDEIINKKENLINSLEKYKKSVITEAVTKGKLGDKYINEDGELVDEIEIKDSGVEWIGEIPEFIDAVKIKRLTQIKRGASPRPIDNPIYFDDNGEYSWVRISDVTKSDDYLLDTEQTLSKLGASKSVKMNKGDIFLSIAATVGKPIITNIKCCIHDGFVYFPQYKESKKFLFYIFKSEQPYRGLGKHGTQINLNTTIVGDIKIPYFEKSNQEKIANYLDQKTTQINNLIKKTKESIKKYKEYKKSLIFEAVTGKIDLRDYELKGGEELAEHNNTSTADRKRVPALN